LFRHSSRNLQQKSLERGIPRAYCASLSWFSVSNMLSDVTGSTPLRLLADVG